jgi:hypothetical protein
MAPIARWRESGIPRRDLWWWDWWIKSNILITGQAVSIITHIPSKSVSEKKPFRGIGGIEETNEGDLETRGPIERSGQCTRMKQKRRMEQFNRALALQIAQLQCENSRSQRALHV